MLAHIRLLDTQSHTHPPYLTQGWHVPIRHNILYIGRSSFSEIVLPFKTISAFHARLYHDKGLLYVEDIGSTNGSYHREKRLYRGHLQRVLPDVPVRFGDIQVCIEACRIEASKQTSQRPIHALPTTPQIQLHTTL
ncbi:MAG: hypothetical protein CL920_11620 [Deltaproteobacteria bacterium]|nr:hypothetical protein [Deltaproteobacteria bacterium]